jgi:6-phosphogluconolactonase
MTRMQWITLCVCLAMFGKGATAMLGDDAAKGKCLAYIGTYTGEKSKGVYACEFDLASGKAGEPKLVAEVKSPSFLAVHPNKKFLYSVNEIDDFNGKPTGGVSAFGIDRASGKLSLLNQQPSGGGGPCHLVVDHSGRTVLVANYGGGSVAALPIGADGKLAPAATVIQHQGHSVDKSRQEAPHAHSINVDQANKYAVAADLGLDKLLVYKFDAATSKLTPNDPPAALLKPGSGPRHFAFHPNGKFAYCINEMVCTATAFSYDAARGVLTELQTISTLPSSDPFKSGYSTAEIQVHPSGKFVYGSNRGHDTIVVYAVDEGKGTLKYVENRSTGGKTPRGFGIDPTGRWLLAGNQDSHTVKIFRIDPASGKLTPTGQTLEVGMPVCVKFVMD